MNGRVLAVVVAGIVAILIVDVGAGYIPKKTGIADEWFLIPTLIVYAATGFGAGWKRSIATATVAALIVAFVDVTVGWSIGERINPDPHLFEGAFQGGFVVMWTFRLTLSLGALCGIGAGVAAQRMAARKRTSDAA